MKNKKNIILNDYNDLNAPIYELSISRASISETTPNKVVKDTLSLKELMYKGSDKKPIPYVDDDIVKVITTGSYRGGCEDRIYVRFSHYTDEGACFYLWYYNLIKTYDEDDETEPTIEDFYYELLFVNWKEKTYIVADAIHDPEDDPTLELVKEKGNIDVKFFPLFKTITKTINLKEYNITAPILKLEATEYYPPPKDNVTHEKDIFLHQCMFYNSGIGPIPWKENDIITSIETPVYGNDCYSKDELVFVKYIPEGSIVLVKNTIITILHENGEKEDLSDPNKYYIINWKTLETKELGPIEYTEEDDNIEDDLTYKEIEKHDYVKIKFINKKDKLNMATKNIEMLNLTGKANYIYVNKNINRLEENEVGYSLNFYLDNESKNKLLQSAEGLYNNYVKDHFEEIENSIDFHDIFLNFIDSDPEGNEFIRLKRKHLNESGERIYIPLFDRFGPIDEEKARTYTIFPDSLLSVEFYLCIFKFKEKLHFEAIINAIQILEMAGSTLKAGGSTFKFDKPAAKPELVEADTDIDEEPEDEYKFYDPKTGDYFF